MFSKKISPKVKLIKTNNFVLTFKNFDDLTDCCVYLKRTSKSLLYRWKNGYRLLISFKKIPPLYIIKEFCTVAKIDSTEFSLTEEYGEFICGNDVIKNINAAFNKIQVP